MTNGARRATQSPEPVLALTRELRALRAAIGLTLRELQALTHSSDSSLSRYLDGTTMPPWSVVAALCQLAGRDPAGLDPVWRAARTARRALAQAAARPAAGGHDDAPLGPARLFGRDAEAELLAGAGGSWAVDGMAGVGKTALVVHAARRRAAADGILYLDLHGHTAGLRPVDPHEALATLLRTLGLPDERIPDPVDRRSALWRAELARRSCTVLLDNAADTDQVRPLLTGAGPSTTWVTSRRRLVGLPGVRRLTLGLLSSEAAVAVFADGVGAERVDADRAACSDVVELCGRLPLALQVAAARMQHRTAWTFEHMATLLRDESRRDTVLAPDDAGGIGAALAMSLSHLDDRTRALFVALGSAPGSRIDRWLAAAAGGTDLAEAERLLAELVDVSLLEEPAPGRYRMHDLTRDFARRLAATADPAARDRVLEFAIGCGARALHRLAPAAAVLSRFAPDYPEGLLPPMADAAEALAWFDEHVGDLPAVAAAGLAAGSFDRVRALCRQVNRLFMVRGHTTEWLDMSRAMREAARQAADRDDEAWSLLALSGGHHRRGDVDAAVECLLEADRIAAAGPPVMDTGYILNALAVMATEQHRLDDAVEYYRRAVEAFQTVGPARGTAIAQTNLATTLIRLGRAEEALAVGADALASGADNLLVVANVRLAMGEARLRLGAVAESAALYRAALEVATASGYREPEICAHVGLATVHRAAGDLAAALAEHALAAELIGDGAEFPPLANALNQYARTLIAAGDGESARGLAERALAAAVRAGNPVEQAAARELLAVATDGGRRAAADGPV